MNTKHTLGPWRWYWRIENDEPNCGVFAEPREGHAYSVARCPRYQTPEQWKADAQLIAAAPEMLEALRKADALLATVLPTIDGYVPHQGLATIHDKVRAAIAKAEGLVAGGGQGLGNQPSEPIPSK